MNIVIALISLVKLFEYGQRKTTVAFTHVSVNPNVVMNQFHF